jgi:hypothetical protein
MFPSPIDVLFLTNDQVRIVSRIAPSVASEDGSGRVSRLTESPAGCRKSMANGVKFLRFPGAALVATQ